MVINAPSAAAAIAPAAAKQPGGEKSQAGGFTDLLESIFTSLEEQGVDLEGLAAGAGGEDSAEGMPLPEDAGTDGEMIEVGEVAIPLDFALALAKLHAASGDESAGAVDGEAMVAAAQVLAELAGAEKGASGGKASDAATEAKSSSATESGDAASADTAVEGAEDTGADQSGEDGADTEPDTSGELEPTPDAADTSADTEQSAGDGAEEQEQRVGRTAGNANNSAEASASAQATAGADPASVDAPAGANGPQGPSAPSGPAAASGAARPIPTPQPSASQQIGRAVFEQVSAGGGDARIQLDPPELGELLIRVRIDGDMVRVDVRAERPETAQMLRQGSLDLTSLLGQRGLDLLDVTVDHGGRDAWEAAQEARDQQEDQRRRQDQGFAAILGIDDPDGDLGVRQHNRLRGAYNPDGELMYRV